MRIWRSSYRCQHHRWRPPWKNWFQRPIMSKLFKGWIKVLSTSLLDQSQQRTLSEWPEWMNIFQTMMSDLFIGFVRCFPTFRRVVKEREKAAKVVLHFEVILPVSSKRGVLWLLWSHILTRWSWELDTKSDKDDEEMKKEIPGHKKVQTTISPLDRCTPPGVRGEHTLNL